MTDHKAEAISHISPEHTDPRNPPNAAGQAAQVHATLYLAQQQHIANLIDYANKRYPDARTSTGDLIHSMIRDGLELK